MWLSFRQPLLLLLIPAAVCFILLTYKRIPGLAAFRRKLVVSLRILIFILLVLALAGMGIRVSSGQTSTIFAVDGSESVHRARSAVEAFLKQAIDARGKDDKVGMVQFASDAAVEFMPSFGAVFQAFQTVVNPNFTDIRKGLEIAASMIPAKDKKRIVLVSDGRENSGDALKEVRLLRQQGITVDVFPVKVEAGPEVQMNELRIPETLRLNERFEITVNIESTVDTPAVLKLYAGKTLASEKNIELRKGSNAFVFSDLAKEGGMVIYTAEVQPASDRVIKNNKMSAFSDVEDAAKVLVVQDEDEGASELIKMINDDIRVDVMLPQSLPVTPEGLQAYDAFIISNVSAEKLDDRFLKNLETTVRTQGKGLLVTGGENSYAPGGYYKTELEKVLPVNMDIKPKEEDPNLGLVLVIDKSGSMTEGQYGISKVELAKEAAIRSSEVLTPRDMIGVIAFDSAAQWVVRTQKVENLKGIQDAIGSIRAGGGTQILPALEEAFKSLRNADTRLKHIILLTDGQAEKTGYEAVLQGMKEQGITLSTVAVGRMADVPLLQSLAQGGNGRFYLTDEFTDVPKIFAKETFLAGKTYLNNRTFTPSLKNYLQVLQGIEAVPVLDGYVATTPKSAARVVLASDTGDPVLATWQYGLGKTAAWTPDAKGMWTSSWLQWEQSQKFWKNLVSWVLEAQSHEDFSLHGEIAAGKGSIELTLPPEERSEDEEVKALMISPEGKEQEIALTPVSPGKFEGTFEIEETGVYVANIQVISRGQTVKSINSGISIPYSPEHHIIREDSDGFLERLAYEGGGRVITDPSQVFAGELPEVAGINDMTDFLLICAILLLLMEITIRRLNLPFERWWALFTGSAGKLAHRAGEAAGKGIERIRDRRAVPKAHGVKPAPYVSGDETKAKKHPSNQTDPSGEEQKSMGSDSHINVLLEKKKKREGR